MSIIIKTLLGGREQYNPEKFRSQLNALGGPASPSSFYVNVGTPRSLLSGNFLNASLAVISKGLNFFNRRTPLALNYEEKITKEVPRDLQFLAHSAVIPGKTIQTLETSQGYNPYTTKMPTGVLMDELTVNFYVRGGLLERMFFELWQQSIIKTFNAEPNDNKTRNLSELLSNAFNEQFTDDINQIGKDLGLKNNLLNEKDVQEITNNSVGYYGDYISDIELYYFDSNGEKTFKVTFLECYPTLITPIQLDWASQNEVIKLSVNFAYKLYKMEPIQPGDVKRAAYFAKGLSEGNLKQAAQSIFTIAKSI